VIQSLVAAVTVMKYLFPDFMKMRERRRRKDERKEEEKKKENNPLTSSGPPCFCLCKFSSPLHSLRKQNLCLLTNASPERML
jgi:hypothetical protein